MSSIAGKVVIVTGSSSGLGQSIAVLFASRGASVTLCGQDHERLQSVFEEVVKVSGGHQDRFLTVKGDLNDQSVRKDIVMRTVEKFGRLNILVANAGIFHPSGTIADATEEVYNQTMDTNVKSVFFLIQQAVPYLEKTKGNIVINSSILSSIVTTPSLIYPMSKAAIDHLAHCLSVDLGPKGIRVNTVNPSFIPSRLLRFSGIDINDAIKERGVIETPKQPLSNRIGTPDDVAVAVVFLSSDAAGFITGQNLRVDGGRSFTGPFLV